MEEQNNVGKYHQLCHTSHLKVFSNKKLQQSMKILWLAQETWPPSSIYAYSAECEEEEIEGLNTGKLIS